MSFDIRVPIGLLFLALGGVLVGWGFVSDPAIYREHSFGVNINLGWGLVMALFGAVMLVAGRGKASRARPARRGPGG
jgi:hypothetical protein